MLTLSDIEKLQENDGLTLKNGKAISYKTGYQVATEGVICKSAKAALRAIHKYKDTCGVWLEKGLYYIDKSQRVKTKKDALELGREHNQISILKWSDMSLVYC